MIQEAKSRQFVDLYDFLGIPAWSPAAPIYLAIAKIESGVGELGDAGGEEIRRYLELAREHLWSDAERRQIYEKRWMCHCLGKMLAESRKTDENWSVSGENPDGPDEETYFVVKTTSAKKEVSGLSPTRPTSLPPLRDNIRYRGPVPHLCSRAEMRAMISNLNLGKMLGIDKPSSTPLSTGDRIEFAGGMQIVLYSILRENACPTPESTAEDLALYLPRENAVVPLVPGVSYLAGRAPAIVEEFLPPQERTFRYITTLHHDRTVSRLNFQLFCRRGTWCVRDAGSWYGTTVDDNRRSRLRTLGGGEIAPLRPGRLRLGYDKSYIIEVDTRERCGKMRRSGTWLPGVKPNVSIYDLPLLAFS